MYLNKIFYTTKKIFLVILFLLTNLICFSQDIPDGVYMLSPYTDATKVLNANGNQLVMLNNKSQPNVANKFTIQYHQEDGGYYTILMGKQSITTNIQEAIKDKTQKSFTTKIDEKETRFNIKSAGQGMFYIINISVESIYLYYYNNITYFITKNTSNNNNFKWYITPYSPPAMPVPNNGKPNKPSYQSRM